LLVKVDLTTARTEFPPAGDESFAFGQHGTRSVFSKQARTFFDYRYERLKQAHVYVSRGTFRPGATAGFGQKLLTVWYQIKNKSQVNFWDCIMEL